MVCLTRVYSCLGGHALVFPHAGGTDYSSILNQQLTFSATVLQQTALVSITEDLLVEVVEVFLGQLSDPAIERLTIVPSTANIDIPNDDSRSLCSPLLMYTHVTTILHYHCSCHYWIYTSHVQCCWESWAGQCVSCTDLWPACKGSGSHSLHCGWSCYL